MARIDTSTIDGYENMSAEEKLAALESFEYEDGGEENRRLRNSLSKANKEASDWKKKHNALISEDEQQKQAREEETERLKTRVAELERGESVAKHRANLLSVGYDDKSADTAAQMLVDGNIDGFFACQKKFLEEHDKAMKVELLKNTPTPPAGSAAGTVDYAKKAAEAQSRGDLSLAAYYTRLAQQQAVKT